MFLWWLECKVLETVLNILDVIWTDRFQAFYNPYKVIYYFICFFNRMVVSRRLNLCGGVPSPHKNHIFVSL